MNQLTWWEKDLGSCFNDSQPISFKLAFAGLTIRSGTWERDNQRRDWTALSFASGWLRERGVVARVWLLLLLLSFFLSLFLIGLKYMNDQNRKQTAKRSWSDVFHCRMVSVGPCLESKLLEEPLVFACLVSKCQIDEWTTWSPSLYCISLPFFQFLFHITNSFSSETSITERVFVDQTLFKVNINGVTERNQADTSRGWNLFAFVQSKGHYRVAIKWL